MSSCEFGSASSGSCSPASCASSDDGPWCWICLGGSEGGEPLLQPCGCPRYVHRSCLSRWQLQQAGKEEERTCRFCFRELPDWRTAHEELPKATPVMTVVYNNETHSILVQPGPEGEAQFIREVRRIFQLSESAELALSFGCRLPNGQGEVTLEGASAFGAAAFLASLSAGERLQRAAAQHAQQAQRAQRESEDVQQATPVQSATSRWRRLF